MKGKVLPQPNDPNWGRLLDTEQELEAKIATAEADGRVLVAQARAAAASKVLDPAASAALAAAQEQADVERHRGEFARIAEGAETTVRAVTAASDSLIDALARLALGAVLADRLPAERR